MYTVEHFKNSVNKRDDFKFWFRRIGLNKFVVLHDDKQVGAISCNDNGDEIEQLHDSYNGQEEAILEDFDKFRTRPEFKVGEKFDPDEKYVDEMVNLYEELLLGTAMIRNEDKVKDNEIEFIEKFEDKCLGWLRKTDFYQAPASTVYHESCVGGLLHHSLRVVSEIYELSVVPKFASVPFDGMTLTALTHDWCKIGLYLVDYRNAKNDDGVWEKVPYFKRNNNHFMPLGHGVTSMYEVQKFFSLALEEACAIRHHMGVWNCHEAEYNDLQEANHRFPLVHMLQFADQLSIVRY